MSYSSVTIRMFFVSLQSETLTYYMERMKKLCFALLFAVVSLSASAQFEQSTGYLSASLTGLNLSYSSRERVHFGLNVTGGYFFEDSWMAYGVAGYNHRDQFDEFDLGAGARYYIVQNGLYLNMGLKYRYVNTPGMCKVNNFLLTPEVGYCFYLNHYLSIEPAVYYDLSLNHFSDYSTVGLKIGFGYYF